MPLGVTQRGGPGGAPTADGSSSGVESPATTRGVSGPASPAGDDNLNPAGGVRADDGRGDSSDDLELGGDDNPIPYSRVRTMREKWTREAEQRARAAALEEMQQQLYPFLQEVQQLRERADPKNTVKSIADALLKQAGIEQEPEKPQYVTRQQLEELRREERERAERDWQQRDDVARAENDLREAKVRHKQIFEAFPQIEDMAAAMWGSPYAVEKNLTFAQIVDDLAKGFTAAVGRLNEQYVEDKQTDARQQVVTPAGGAARGTPSARKPEHDLSTDEGTEAATRAFLQRNRTKLGAS